MKKILGNAIYPFIISLVLIQIISLIYSSAVGISHTAQFNIIAQEEKQLLETKLKLETSLAQQQAISSARSQIENDLIPMNSVISLSNPNNLALLQ